MFVAYSQKDPAYRDVRLGKSKLTIGSHGCFVCAIATLYQVHPLEILKIPGGVRDDGLVVQSIIAAALGGDVDTSPTPPNGWCIAVTDHYRPQGFETHFYCYNKTLNKRIDMLDFPAVVEGDDYRHTQYRVFTGIKLTGAVLEDVGPFPDVPAGSSGADQIAAVKAAGIMGGYPDGLFRPDQFCTRRELAIVAARLKGL